MDTLFDIPESVPKWRELADRHGITTTWSEESGEWTAHIMSPSRGIDAFPDSTERAAVITLIHRLKLDGWNTVSI